MNDIERLCDRCAAEGVEAVNGLDVPEVIEALAVACFARAKKAQEQGDQRMADRLADAAQYLRYLIFPYD
jgi:hypothetical protein